MNLSEHINKDNLHHAYLIEGAQTEVLPALVEFLGNMGISTIGNADFMRFDFDSFKIDDARQLKSFSLEKSQNGGKRIFIITANNFLLEAQNSLLKMFEEPIENTHFFLIVPDTNALLRTLVSRFFLIKSGISLLPDLEAEEFLKLSLRDRLDFFKDLLAEPEKDEEEEEAPATDSARAKALRFLNSLESSLHARMLKVAFDPHCFEHIFKVREILRMPGSSLKSLMESVALVTPTF